MNTNSFSQADKQSEKRRGERRRARTRADLLEAARQVFALRGYHDASIAEITEMAGVAVGTFYLYFRDKDEAFTVVLEEGFRETLEQVKRAVMNEDRHALEVVIRAIFRHAHEKSYLFRVALMAGGQFARITRVQDAIEEVVSTALTATMNAQEQTTYDLPLLARFLTGMILQGIMWWFEQEQPDPEEMTERLLMLLRDGLPRHVIMGSLEKA